MQYVIKTLEKDLSIFSQYPAGSEKKKKEEAQAIKELKTAIYILKNYK